MNDHSDSQRHSAVPRGNMEERCGFNSSSYPKLVKTPKIVGKALGIWIHPFTRLHKIPVFRKIWLYILVMGVYSFVCAAIVDVDFSTKILKEVGNAAYLGVIFGLLLVFRTNSAYERWWEGRRQWGILVNETRNLALKLKAYSSAPIGEKIKFGEQMVSFCYALKHHLRDSRPTRDLPGLEPINQIPVNIHIPAYVSGKMVDTLEKWNKNGYLTELKMMMLDHHFSVFMDVCGACERIKSTPLAVSYRAFLRQGILMNLLVLPWIVIPMLGDLLGIGTTLVASYFLIGLELIAEDIEEPFGEGGDDLPLDTICSKIQKSIAEILAVSNSRRKFTSTASLSEMNPLKYTTSVKKENIDPLKGE